MTAPSFVIPSFHLRMKWVVTVLTIVFACCIPEYSYASTLPAAKTTTYLLPIGEHDLRQVLVNFGKSIGFAVSISPEVTGSVPGTGQLQPIADFVNTISARCGLSWFTFRDTVYFARNQDAVEASINVKAPQQASLRTALVAMKLLDEKFTWTEIPEQNQILIYGPRTYIQLVKQQVARIQPVPTKLTIKAPAEMAEMMIFKLKYALAGDKSSDSAGTTLSTPGVVSILKSLYKPMAETASVSRRRFSPLGRDKPPSAFSFASSPIHSENQSTSMFVGNRAVPEIMSLDASDPTRSEPAEPRRYSPNILLPIRESPRQTLNAYAAEPLADPEAYTSAAQANSSDEPWPTIEADPRTNSVIIRDRSSHRAEYERLIASLDTPTQQIELETILIDMQEEDIAKSLAKLPNRSNSDAALRKGMILIKRETADALISYARAISKRGRAGSADLTVLSQTVVFKQDEPFNLDFSDDHIYPELSDPLWRKLAAEVVSTASQSEPKVRSTALKMTGTANFADGKVELQATIEESRNRPDLPTKTVDRRHTGLQMSIGLHEGDVCVLSNTSFFTGSDMADSRGRLVLLSARRFGNDAN